jgi:hypothetical protein
LQSLDDVVEERDDERFSQRIRDGHDGVIVHKQREFVGVFRGK